MRTRSLVFGIAASMALHAARGSSDDNGSDTTAAPANISRRGGGHDGRQAAPPRPPARRRRRGRQLARSDPDDRGRLHRLRLQERQRWHVDVYRRVRATTAGRDHGLGRAPAGLDPQVFSVVEGADEIYQLKAGDWPLSRSRVTQRLGTRMAKARAACGSWSLRTARSSRATSDLSMRRRERRPFPGQSASSSVWGVRSGISGRGVAPKTPLCEHVHGSRDHKPNHGE